MESMYDDEAKKVIGYIIEDIDGANVKDVLKVLERAAQLFSHYANNALYQMSAENIVDKENIDQ